MEALNLLEFLRIPEQIIERIILSFLTQINLKKFLQETEIQHFKTSIPFTKKIYCNKTSSSKRDYKMLDCYKTQCQKTNTLYSLFKKQKYFVSSKTTLLCFQTSQCCAIIKTKHFLRAFFVYICRNI